MASVEDDLGDYIPESEFIKAEIQESLAEAQLAGDALTCILDLQAGLGEARAVIVGLIAAGSTRVFWDKAVEDAIAFLDDEMGCERS